MNQWLEDKLPHFPVSAFSIVMGLSGFTIALGRFYHLQWLPKWPYDTVLAVDFLVFLLLLTLYALKVNYFPEEVKGELKHPVRVNFFATIPISFLLLAIAFYGYWPLLSVCLWWVGMLGQAGLTLYTMGFWIDSPYDVKHCNPSWFIPVVGNILIPITGVDLLPKEFSFFFWAMGMLFWIVLFTIIFYRLIFHPPLAAKMLPTLFIFIAPAAVGYISYTRISQSWDTISMTLLFLTYFFVALLISLVLTHKPFRRMPFALSWWACTFPVAAATIATTIAWQVTRFPLLQGVAWLLLGATFFLVTVVFMATVWHVRLGDICTPED